jgi:hypothetical protein
VQQGIPGSAPPSNWAKGDNDLGPQAGIQAKEQWTAQARDSRSLASFMRAPHLWRLNVTGSSNVRVRISFGTSSNQIIFDVIPPIRITVPGSLDVYAAPITEELNKPAHAEVAVTPVTSGCCDSECRKLIAAGAAFDENCASFFALEDSGVSIQGNMYSVASGTRIPILAGSTCVSGGGYQEFEP